MTKLTLSILIGYLLGCANPASRLAARKHTDLRTTGTKNLGATNVAVTMGRKYGALVMVLDILKGWLAVHIARQLMPTRVAASLMAGVAAIVGHIFPAQLKFKGGKGLAAFGGVVLAFSPQLFLFLLTTGCALALLCNYGVAVAFSAATLAPVLGGLQTGSFAVFCVLAVGGGLVIWKHWGNLGAIRDGTEMKVRDHIKHD